MVYQMRAYPGILAGPPLLRGRRFGAADVFEPSTAAPESYCKLCRSSPRHPPAGDFLTPLRIGVARGVTW